MLNHSSSLAACVRVKDMLSIFTALYTFLPITRAMSNKYKHAANEITIEWQKADAKKKSFNVNQNLRSN